MTTMNLNSLLADLEKSVDLEKSASVKEDTPAVNADVLTKKAEQDLTKEAYASGEALAKTLLEKFANEIIVNDTVNQASDDAKVAPNSDGSVREVLENTVENGLEHGATSDDIVDALVDEGKGAPVVQENTETNKEDEVETNIKLAEYIFTKLAEETVLAESSAQPNIIQVNDAVNQASDEAKVLPNPEGSVNNILEAIVARAQATGAGNGDLTLNGGVTPEVVPAGGQVAAPAPSDEQEKAAAVSYLVDSGVDFDTAISLVKQAESELKGESFEQEKQAAFEALTAEGFDFDTAIALIKQAEEDLSSNFNQGAIDKEAGLVGGALKSVKSLGQKVVADAKTVAPNAKMLATGKAPAGSLTMAGSPSNRVVAAKTLAKNKAVQAGAGTAALGALALSGGSEKQAEDNAPTDGEAWGATGRAYGRSTLETIAGGALGAGIGAAIHSRSPRKNIVVAGLGLNRRPSKTTVGAGLGAVVGSIHGSKASIKNSLKKQHDKQAAFEALTAEGIDFDTAVALIKQAEEDLYGE